MAESAVDEIWGKGGNVLIVWRGDSDTEAQAYLLCMGFLIKYKGCSALQALAIAVSVPRFRKAPRTYRITEVQLDELVSLAGERNEQDRDFLSAAHVSSTKDLFKPIHPGGRHFVVLWDRYIDHFPFLDGVLAKCPEGVAQYKSISTGITNY